MLPKYSYRHKLSHISVLYGLFYFKLFFSSSGDEERAKRQIRFEKSEKF